MKALDLFERIVFSAKRLVLDYDLSDEEAKEISAATDKVNEIRGKYTDRKLTPAHRDNPDGRTDNG
jgi:hypothetical protein